MRGSLEGLSEEEITALAATAKVLRDNPKTRMGFLRLAKAANPDLVVPEVETEDRLLQTHRALNDRFNTIEAKHAEIDGKEAVNVLYEELRDEGIVGKRADFNDLVRYAADKGFQTTGAGLRMAYNFRKEEQRIAEPTPTFLSQGTPVSLDKDLMKNPLQWARRTAATAINELKQQSGRK